MSNLGDFIAKLREEKGWTQRELGRRAGLSQTTIHKLEAGITEHPGVDVLVALASALKIPMLALVMAYQGKTISQSQKVDIVYALKEEVFEAVEQVFTG